VNFTVDISYVKQLPRRQMCLVTLLLLSVSGRHYQCKGTLNFLYCGTYTRSNSRARQTDTNSTIALKEERCFLCCLCQDFIGIWLREPYTEKKENNCRTKKLKSGHGPIGGPAPRRTGRQSVGRNITWNWTCAVALQITDPSFRQRGRPTWKNSHSNLTSGHPLRKGQNTKTSWPTVRRS
jgi:hypothetical protein